MAGDLIALFEFEDTPEGIRKSTEKHYRLVPQAELSTADLELYRTRSD